MTPAESSLSEEWEFLAHSCCSCHPSDLLDSRPCPPRASPPLASSGFGWLPWTNFLLAWTSAIAGSLRGAGPEVTPGQSCPGIIQEECGKGGPHPRRTQAFRFWWTFPTSDTRHLLATPHPPVHLTSREATSQGSGQGTGRRAPQEFCVWTCTPDHWV